MTSIRWWALCVFALFLTAGTAAAMEPPKYTANPERYWELKDLSAKAAWLTRTWEDPKAVFKEKDANQEELKSASMYLGIEDYKIQAMTAWSAAALRVPLAKTLVAEAGWDPLFEAVLTIAASKPDSAALAIQQTQLLTDTVEALVDEFPAIAEPSRKVFLERLSSEYKGSAFAAIEGLSLLPREADSHATEDALVKLVADEDQVIVAAAAEALGKIGTAGAVRPLMEKFLSIEEDTDPAVAEDASVVKPLNHARFAIAAAVGQLTGIDRALDKPGNKAEILSKYDDLVEWWKANEKNYK
ncbi:MAG: HEAT repeat domain-containing protein [Planctomycetes bacterium]|nr:HEAT repeat domain-containing protein [Planctomycetota bacterium]